MFNSTLKIGLSFLFIFQLVGCGSDEGSKEASGESNVVESAVSNESKISHIDAQISNEEEHSLIEEAKEEMNLLVASLGFEFTTKQKIGVKLDLIEELSFTDQIDQRAYVSIYRDYQLLDSNAFYPDASSRVIGGDLQNGIFNHSFVSLNSQSSYLVEIWFYNGEEPIQKEIEVIDNSLTW